MVLPFAAGGAAKLDGVLRAIVVAGLAMCAMSVPTGMAVHQGDVLQGADAGAKPAAHTSIGGKVLLVRDPLVEALADGVGLEPWHGAALQVHPGATLFDGLHQLGKADFGL